MAGFETTTDKIKEQKEALIAYMKSKIDVGDWHAVSDAANDIRELDAKLEVYNGLDLNLRLEQGIVGKPPYITCVPCVICRGLCRGHVGY